MRKFFLLSLLTISTLLASADYTIEDQPQALDICHSIEAVGTLKQKKNGFVYLDVSNRFIDDVAPVLSLEGQINPNLTGKKSLGAHISVMTQQEAKALGVIEELGRQFKFQADQIRSFYVKGSKLWAVIVESPELSTIREKYGLAPKLKGHDFHITMGKQVATAGGEIYQFEGEVKEIVKSPDYTVEDQAAAMEKIREIKTRGTLRQKSNGFVYLDVDNRFIDEVVPLLDYEGMIRPRPTASRSIGAHLSVFTESELAKAGIWNVAEIGKTYDFAVKEIRSFTIHTPDGLKRIWAIAADSPELEALRRSYGLSSKLKGYDFHISLGKQLPTALTDEEKLADFTDEGALPMEEIGSFVKVDTVPTIKGRGKLIVKGNGYVYLDVSDEYVEQFTSQLEGILPISVGEKKMGAHISVILEDEMIGKQIWTLEEGSQLFDFEIKELRTVKTPTKELWVLAVDAPALQKLRMKYGLKPKLKGYDFHITLGQKVPVFAQAA